MSCFKRSVVLVAPDVVELGAVARLGVDKANAGVPYLAGQLGAVPHGDRASIEQSDIARVIEQRAGASAAALSAATEIELVRPFQEELPVLGKEQWKARQVDTLLVVLNLGKIGIDREVCRQVGGNLDLEVLDAELAATVGQRRIGRVERRVAAGQVGLEPVATRERKASQTEQVTTLRDVAKVEAAAVVAPVDLFVGTPNLAVEIDAPDMRTGVEPQRLEGDLHLRLPAIRRDSGGSLPFLVPAGVNVALPLHRRVVLGAERVDTEQKTVAVIVERVEQHRDAIVGLQTTVAAQVGGDDAVGLVVVHHEAQIEVAIVEQDAHLGAMCGNSTLYGLAL